MVKRAVVAFVLAAGRAGSQVFIDLETVDHRSRPEMPLGHSALQSKDGLGRFRDQVEGIRQILCAHTRPWELAMLSSRRQTRRIRIDDAWRPTRASCR